MNAAEITSRTAWITALLLGLQGSLGLFRVHAVPATLLLVLQIFIGGSMLGTVEHARTRRMHLAIATVLVALAGAHIALNG